MMLLRCLLLLLCVSSAFAQGRGTVEERYKAFENYLVRRAMAVTSSFPGGIRTLDQWKQARPEVRKRFLYTMGLDPMPKRTPLNARVTGQFERDTYRVEKIVFESMPGLYVTGNLYLPKDRSGKLPAVLYLCGHSPGPWGAKVRYQHHGIWLARHGYAAFLIDTIEFGEIPGIHHGTHDLEMWDWLSLGYTPAGPEVWNAIRALDYLETRPEVDASKMAVTGISGGGAMTWYTAAADDRVQVAAPVCATWTAGHHTALDAVHENCDCIYFVNAFLEDLPVVGALIAPRPLKIISAKRDPSFPTAGYHDVFERLRSIYQLYGAGEKVAEYDHDAPHSDILPFRKEANEWLNRWLKNDNTPFDEGQIEREEPEILTALDQRPANAINGHIHKTFVATPAIKAPASLKAWETRRAKILSELKDKSLRAFPTGRVPFNTTKVVSKDWATNYTGASRVEFTTEEGIRITGQLYVPHGSRPEYPGLIYVKGRQDIVYPIDYDLLLPAWGNHVVLVVQPRATDYPMNNYKTATVKRTAALIGATIESMQLWDILRSVDFLLKESGTKISSVSLYARRDMTVPAMYAAALDERVSRLIVEDAPYSHWQGPAILNALRFTDLPEVAAMVAPREIVALTPLPSAYELTRIVYALYGKKASVRQAPGLAGALQVWKHQ